MSSGPVSSRCEAARPELGAFVDGELDAAQREEIERHLQGCPACRAELELLRLVTRSLGLLPRPEPPEAVRRRLLAQLAAERPPRKIDLFCMERHGEQAFWRRETRSFREPAPVPALGSKAPPRRASAIHEYRREWTSGSYSCQVIESYQRGEYDERRA